MKSFYLSYVSGFDFLFYLVFNVFAHRTQWTAVSLLILWVNCWLLTAYLLDNPSLHKIKLVPSPETGSGKRCGKMRLVHRRAKWKSTTLKGTHCLNWIFASQSEIFPWQEYKDRCWKWLQTLLKIDNWDLIGKYCELFYDITQLLVVNLA